MVQAQLVAFDVVNLFQVVLCSIEQAMAQGDLLSFVLTAAMPMPRIFAGAVLQAIGFDEPKDQRSLTTTASDFSLVVDDRRVNLCFEPFRCFFRRQSVDAAFETGDDKNRVIDKWQIVIGPTRFAELPKLSDADDLRWLAELVQLVGIPQQRNAASCPQVVVDERCIHGLVHSVLVFSGDWLPSTRTSIISR